MKELSLIFRVVNILSLHLAIIIFEHASGIVSESVK